MQSRHSLTPWKDKTLVFVIRKLCKTVYFAEFLIWSDLIDPLLLLIFLKHCFLIGSIAVSIPCLYLCLVHF